MYKKCIQAQLQHNAQKYPTLALQNYPHSCTSNVAYQTYGETSWDQGKLVPATHKRKWEEELKYGKGKKGGREEGRTKNKDK